MAADGGPMPPAPAPAPAKPAAEAAKTAAAVPPPKAPRPAPPGVPAAPPWWRQLRTDPHAAMRLVLGLGMVALLLFLWWFLTHGAVIERIISPVKLPSPGEVFGSFRGLWQRGVLDSAIDTLVRVLKGVLLASAIGIGLGVLSAAQRGVNAALTPIVIFLRSVPMGALIPLTLIMFSGDEHRKTMFIFLAIVPFVFSDTVKAVSLVPERFVETAQTLGATRFQIVLKVLIPLATPDIVTSIRFQFGLALGYIMLVETDAAPGLGKLINSSQREGPYEHVYLLLFVIALLAFSIDILLRTLQRGVFPWRRDL